jgi:hypothetical protein
VLSNERQQKIKPTARNSVRDVQEEQTMAREFECWAAVVGAFLRWQPLKYQPLPATAISQTQSEMKSAVGIGGQSWWLGERFIRRSPGELK